ncbi:MAG: aminotransferase class I/II-fold pyridoxal phosphate-dependent enzyme, partial [Chloroflexota bacterium]
SELLAHASDERRQQWENLTLGYTESQGHPDLLTAISELYDTITPQQIISVIPEEGIFIAMNTLVQAGDHMICMFPGYQSLYEIARSRGVDVTYWQPDENHAFDVSQLPDLLQANTRLLVVNTPHNPTGYHFSQADWQTIIAFARDNDLWLFSDEMYRLSEHDPADRLISASDAYAKSVSLSGLSKSFGLPGLRVGWLATQSETAMQSFVAFKDYTTICGSAPSEILAIIALEAHQPLIKRNLDIVAHNLALLDEFFASYSHLMRWQRPRAGTIGLVEWLGDESVDALAENLVTSHGVMILPASVYDYAGDYFRIGFGRKTMPAALEQLSSFLDERF